MKRLQARLADPVRSNAKLRAVPRTAAAPRPRAEALPTLATARVVGVDGDDLHVDLGGQIVSATRDGSLHPTVLRGAFDRGERVLVERDAAGSVVVIGTLRTQPTPGIDAADSFTIEAERISIRASRELSLGAEAAALILRAVGEVETVADRIVSRAESVHKIVGRVLRLN